MTIDPWQGLRMLRTRQSLDGAPAGGWLPEERVTIEQATRATPWRGLRRTARGDRGSIAPGKVADLIVLSRDVLTVPPDLVAKATVLVTVAGGRIVHDAR